MVVASWWTNLSARLTFTISPPLLSELREKCTIAILIKDQRNSLAVAYFPFLSDPSPIIGNACHSLTHSLTNSLTHCRLVILIDVTLAFEDDNSKLVEVVTVADVDDEDRVGNSLLQIWKLRFGHKAKFYSDLQFG